jgi:hypothetical protein
MSHKQLAHLPQIFRSPFLRKVAVGNYYHELAERLEFAGLSHMLTRKLAAIFQNVYELLIESYRCEYVFKNELIKMWFKSKRSEESAYLTDEFRVGSCRVDLAVFSTSSIAFEIKTDFDSGARLESQSSEYIKVFDLVYVVTTEKMLTRLEASIPKNVGILTLDSSNGFRTERESERHAHQIDLLSAFNCLRQGERLEVITKVSGRKIEAPTSQLYTECRKAFKVLLPFEAHTYMNEQIRSRGHSSATAELLNVVPCSLTHAAFTVRASHREMRQIQSELKSSPTRKSRTKTRSDENILPIPQGETERTDCAKVAG